MRLLLDTHAFLWFIAGDERLGEAARTLMVSPTTERLLSVASLWEMSIKASLGRLDLDLSFTDLVAQQVTGNGIALLSVAPAHLDALARLPFHHKDPFDRLVIAQAAHEQATVLSRDAAFAAYGVPVVWP